MRRKQRGMVWGTTKQNKRIQSRDRGDIFLVILLCWPLPHSIRRIGDGGWAGLPPFSGDIGPSIWGPLHTRKQAVRPPDMPFFVASCPPLQSPTGLLNESSETTPRRAHEAQTFVVCPLRRLVGFAASASISFAPSPLLLATESVPWARPKRADQSTDSQMANTVDRNAFENFHRLALGSPDRTPFPFPQRQTGPAYTEAGDMIERRVGSSLPSSIRLARSGMTYAHTRRPNRLT